MFRLPVRQWIGNAAAVLLGRHGAVAAAARAAGCSRPTAYDHAHQVEQAVADAHLPGPLREDLLAEVALLRDENRQLWDALDGAIDLPLARQQQFTAAATAMGLSLGQILALLAILLPQARLPSRATL